MSVVAAQNLEIPQQLRPWLYAQGSLTQQLTHLAGGQFRVQPIAERFATITHHDAVWLGVQPQRLGWLRDSLLFGADAEPWVQARSFFPMTTLQGRGRIFRHLRTRAIGHLLFERTQPLCKRRVFWDEDGWVRQSCYTWHGHPLLVQEKFLKSFVEHIWHMSQQSKN